MKNHWAREHFIAGESIFHEGDVGDDAYLIEHGRISITTQRDGQECVLATIEQGEMFGEIALIDRLTRTASATAIEDATLIRISREWVVSKLKNADPLLSHFLHIVVDRYRDARGSSRQTGEYAQASWRRRLSEYAVGQIKLAQSLSDGLANDEFVLHYQPIIFLADGRLGGFEALVRWNKPNVGLIAPMEFIGAAEDSGLIVPLGRWVLKSALSALKEFQTEMHRRHPEHAALFMNINVSARQLLEFGEIDALAALIRGSGVDPACVRLEVTESALIEDAETAALSLLQFKELGVRLAIDDFGTGYSSLSYLNMFPLDTLKIDQSFIANMRENADSLRITRSIAGLAREMGMSCIAEGIEHAAAISPLCDMHCELGQGFLFSKPRDHAGALEYIKTRGAGR